MWSLYEQHADVIGSIASLGMLVIWLLYLQLFYRSYRSHRRPNLLVQQVGGFGLESRCVIANMSESAVHVAAVLIDVVREGRAWTFRPGPDGPPSDDDPLRHARQGPLRPAEYMDVGTFDDMLTRLDWGPGDDVESATIAVRAVAFVGSEPYAVGVVRRFELRRGADGLEVHPTDALPLQLSDRRSRAVARAWLEEAAGLGDGGAHARGEEPGAGGEEARSA